MRILLLAILGIVTVAPIASAKHGWRGGRDEGYYRYNDGYYRDYGAYRNLPPGIARKGGWLPPGQARKHGGFGWNNRYRDYGGYYRGDDRYYGYGPGWDRQLDRDYYRYNRYNRRYYNPYFGNFWQRLF